MGITVSGEGRVSGTPDVLTLAIGISLERATVSEATADAARLATDLIDILIGEGVSEDDIQTVNYLIHPVHDEHNRTRRLIGYRVINDVSVTIFDLDRAGVIIDTATAGGGDEVIVSGVRFSLKDDKERIAAAREAAWVDAKAKADQLAQLAGVTLGAPSSIKETASTPVPVARRMRAVATAYQSATPIEPGEIGVDVNIEVTFGLG